MLNTEKITEWTSSIDLEPSLFVYIYLHLTLGEKIIFRLFYFWAKIPSTFISSNILNVSMNHDLNIYVISRFRILTFSTKRAINWRPKDAVFSCFVALVIGSFPWFSQYHKSISFSKCQTKIWLQKCERTSSETSLEIGSLETMKMLILIWSEGLLIWAGLNEAGGEPKWWPAGGKPPPTIVEVAASGFRDISQTPFS